MRVGVRVRVRVGVGVRVRVRVRVHVDVARSAPSFAQSTHRQHVVSVQQAKTRAPSAVSSCGAAAKTERASTSGQSNATATERERRPATIRSHARRLDCAGGILIERGPASVIGTRALPHESARAQRRGEWEAAATAPSASSRLRKLVRE